MPGAQALLRLKPPAAVAAAALVKFGGSVDGVGRLCLEASMWRWMEVMLGLRCVQAPPVVSTHCGLIQVTCIIL
jgi:hypothetical protein